MLDFVKSQFDKMLLSLIFFLLLGMFLHVTHHQADAGTVQWFENIGGQVLAALLTLMVGTRNATRQSDGNGRVQPVPPQP